MVYNKNVFWMIQIFVTLWKVWYFLGKLLTHRMRKFLFLIQLKMSKFV